MVCQAGEAAWPGPDASAGRPGGPAAAASTTAAILEQLAEGVIVTDATGRIVLVNPAAAAIHGVARLDVEPDAYSETYHLYTLDGRPYVTRDLPLVRAVRGETVLDARWRIRRPDGVEVLAIGSAKPLRDPAGTQTGAVLTLRDDTAREAAERSLRESETRLRTLSDNLPGGAVYQLATDRHGDNRRFLHVSRSYARLTGTPAESLLADAERMYRPLLPEDHARLLRARAEASRAMSGVDVEVRFRHADTGELRWNRIIATPRPVADGSLIWDGLAIDITDQKRAEDGLRELNATLAQRVAERTRDAEAARLEAERASAAKSEFLAAMSHEIRTPLNGILGFAQLLLDEPRLAEGARRHGERIRSAGSALLTVVNDVLDFSKIEAGQIEIEAVPFGLPDLIEDAACIVRGQARIKGLALDVHLDPDLPAWVVGDKDRLRQVLLNLLNNAIKFTPSGRVDLSVEAEPVVGDPGEAGRTRLTVRVRDTGIGIPADKQSRLFQRFSQVDGSIQREYGGTGLGLAICRQLLELMGGTIGLTSAPGRGSTFTVRLDLPVVRGLPRASPSIPAAESWTARTLLLAEDVPLNQELACTILRRAGHRVDVVSTGAEAVEAVAAGRYDLVLMDIHMPGMDGLTATRLIRGLDAPQAGVPIVAMSANVLPQQVSGFLEAGMDGHIGKPFERAALLSLIDRLARAPARAAGRIDGPWAELAATLGEEQTRQLFRSLADELDTRFCRGGTPVDRDALAYDAHAMISAADMLGFAEVAKLCREVEALCRAGAPYDRSFADLRSLSESAIAEIGREGAA